MSEVFDIGVLGSGPAALSLAAEAAALGARVTLVAPEPTHPWKPNYCLWSDELSPSTEVTVEHRWSEVTVATALGVHELRRDYVKLDGLALQRRLLSALEARSARIVDQRAVQLEHLGTESRIHSSSGGTLRVRAVVDASGANSRFVERLHRRKPAYQMAYGLFLEAPGHGFDTERATLMDFRRAMPSAVEPPSFLYVLPLSDRRIFVEETSLAHRPAVSMDLLRERLDARLQTLGLGTAARTGEELCAIPMGLGLPAHGQSVVPFGAAASMVHPASGYSIAHTLRKSKPVARALVDGLGSDDPALAIASANAALWPRAQRRLWELYALGLETLVSMSFAETSRFFDAFFRLPQESWAGYLSGTLTPTKLAVSMTDLFRSLPASVRWHLIRTGMSSGAAPLARTVLQSGIT